MTWMAYQVEPLHCHGMDSDNDMGGVPKESGYRPGLRSSDGSPDPQFWGICSQGSDGILLYLNGSIGSSNGIYLGLKVVPISIFWGLCMYYRAAWTHWVLKHKRFVMPCP